MAEKRKKVASICVKNGAKSCGTLELFPASMWGGSDALYRVRVGRKWLNGVHGDKQFMCLADVSQHIIGTILETTELFQQEPCPHHLVRGVRVSVPTVVGMECVHESTFIATEKPFLGYDGQWYVGVSMCGRGVVVIPCKECIVKCRL